MSQKPAYQMPVGNKDRSNAAVVIIGAGISGICMAIDLIRRAKCHNVVILEKGSGFGGTWRDNVYPGCCCDIWSHLYSFSFEQNPDWSRKFPGQEEILAYVTGVAAKYGLYKHVRFNTSVEQAEWNEEEQKWRTSVKVVGEKDAEYGDAYTIDSDFLISAVGQLNFPSYPNIAGIDDFKGKLLHSARWDWTYNLAGKKIGVIGNGASAVQIVPEVAKLAREVTVFQRSPNWVVPRDDSPFTGFQKEALKIPLFRSRYRAQLMDVRESYHSAIFDPESYLSGEIRKITKGLMEAQIPDKPELWPKLTPNFPPGCKRIIVSDDYYPALNLPNVKLETRPIARFTSTGIQLEEDDDSSSSSKEPSQPYDLIILATGFRTLEFLHPIRITGRDRRPLTSIWRHGAEAYKGVTVASLPNFAMLYGPNTSVTHNSIILMIEAQSRYISALVHAVLSARHSCSSSSSSSSGQGTALSICPTEKAVAAYNERIQKVLRGSSYADPGCRNWFRNEEGRIVTSWSGTVVQYQLELERVCWGDYEVRGEGAGELVRDGNGGVDVGRVVEETRFSYRTLALAVLSVFATAGVVYSKSRKLLQVV